jgi:hypothetical protein
VCRPRIGKKREGNTLNSGRSMGLTEAESDKTDLTDWNVACFVGDAGAEIKSILGID